MGKFGDMFEAAHAKVKSQRPQTHQAPFVLPSETIIVNPESPRPVTEDTATTVEHRVWQATMVALTPLEPILVWAEEQKPGTVYRMGSLEDKCLSLAKREDNMRGSTREEKRERFYELRKQYLDLWGMMCDLYFTVVPNLEYLDLLSRKLGMKNVRVKIGTSDTPPEDGRVEFFVTEIPHLLTATPEQLEDSYKAKEVFSGARIDSMQMRF